MDEWNADWTNGWNRSFANAWRTRGSTGKIRRHTIRFRSGIFKCNKNDKDVYIKRNYMNIYMASFCNDSVYFKMQSNWFVHVKNILCWDRDIKHIFVFVCFRLPVKQSLRGCVYFCNRENIWLMCVAAKATLIPENFFPLITKLWSLPKAITLFIENWKLQLILETQLL